MDMLTWLMTNPFVASVLILGITDPRDPFTYKLEGCCKHLQMWQGSEYTSEAFYYFFYLFILLFF